MSAIITTKFRYQTAVNLINAMGGNGSQPIDSYYMFIGRTEAWADDDNPPTPQDSVYEENSARNSMLSLKLITSPKLVMLSLVIIGFLVKHILNMMIKMNY